MSYINEALKKAQELKDSGYEKYHRMPGSIDNGGIRLRARWLIYSASFVILVFLVFLGYRWFGHSHEDTMASKTDTGKNRAGLEDNSLDRKRLYEKAIGLYNEGRIDEAKKVYEAVVALDPGYVEALNNLGIIYIHEKDFKAAGETFEKAVRLKPSWVESYYNLACLYAIRGDADQGLRYLEKAISLDENVKGWAADDSDLDGLRGSDRFNKIIAQ